MRRRPRSPVVEMLLGGATLLAAAHLVASSEQGSADTRPTIRIPHERVDGARRAFVASSGRAPDALELRALVAAEVDDEILYREALARGLDRDDAVVQRRLTGNLAFVDGCDPAAHAAGTHDPHDREIARDMLARDVVVHRRLSQRMRALVEADALRDEPSEVELAAALARHAERFALPARVRVAHVVLPESSNFAGPPAPAFLTLQSERDLARLLGAPFAHAALSAAPGVWTGPVRSPLGTHLLRVEQHAPARAPELAAVRNQVREIVRRERAAAAVRRALEELRTAYVVEEASAPEDAG